jgi:hypothetical protein
MRPDAVHCLKESRRKTQLNTVVAIGGDFEGGEDEIERVTRASCDTNALVAAAD